MAKRFNNEFRPILVLGFILFCSIRFFEAISNEHLFDLAKLFIAFTVVSPIDLFGTFKILSKAKSSWGWKTVFKYATQSLTSALS